MKDGASCMGHSRIWEPIFVPHDCLAASYVQRLRRLFFFFFFLNLDLDFMRVPHVPGAQALGR